MGTSKKEWYFIINPCAGSGKTMSEWVPAERRLRKESIPFVTEYTNHKRHATSLAYEAAAEGFRRIVAVGGDGSLHETYEGIMQWCNEKGEDPAQFVLGVIPIGSGNDWIKSTGVPHDTSKVIDLIKAESFGQMDVIRVKCEDKLCHMANVGGVGFDSHVCQQVNLQKESGMRGKSIYLKALVSAITHTSAISVRIFADGAEVYHGRIYSFAMGNGKYSGSGMRQVPSAVIDDGMIDYFIVPVTPIKSLIKEIPRLYNGTIEEAKVGISGRCSTLEILPDNPESADLIELDGEIAGRLPLAVSASGHKIGIIKG